MIPHKPDSILTFTVRDGHPSGLLDFLFAVMSDRSKSAVKSFLRHGQVKVGQTVTRQFDFPVGTGDMVCINLSREWPSLRNPRLKIVYEDNDIIVVHKGYGLLSVSTDNKKDGTAYSILRSYLKSVDPRQKLFIVHRLDQHTSGLMLFAKNEHAKNEMQHNWNNMVLERQYITVVEGRMDEKEGVIRSYLAENTRHMVYSVKNPEMEEGAKLAVTRWRTLRTRGNYSMLEVSLDTGRKNQIRVHMKDIGHPIVGDKKYGARTSPIHRLALHAATLRFVHPATRRDMNFSSPAPDAFNKLV